MSGLYLIQKDGLYYRPNRQGYTGLKSEAGRYTRAEALAECRAAHHRYAAILPIRETIASRFAPGCPSELRSAYQPGKPDWEAFAKAVMGVWPTGDLDGGRLQELAEKHRVLRRVEGGFNPTKHHDFEHAAEPGDPWFERNY